MSEDGSGRWVTTEDLAPGMVVVSRDLGTVGRVSAVAGVAVGGARIASSETPGAETVLVAGETVGALGGAYVGGQLGAAAGPAGMVGGAVVGGVAGSFAASSAFSELMHYHQQAIAEVSRSSSKIPMQ